MTSRRHLTLVAAAATLMAAAPISAIFESLSWFFRALVTVAMIAGAAWGVRSLRGRLWTQLAAMIGALIVALTMLHGNGTGILGLIPTPETYGHFKGLMLGAGEQIQTAYVPAPDLSGLTFLTTLGIGSVAILVDLFAVGLRRPAIAGLPMLAIYSVPVAVYLDSVSPLPFIIGAVGFLWLLVSDNVDKVRRFGRRFTGEGRNVDLWEPSPLAATGRRLAVAGVLVAVLLPIAVPGMTAGFFAQFGGQGHGPGNGPGRGGTVDLFANLHGKLTQPNEVDMVKVTTSDPHPFYLKFGVADDVQPNGFRNRAPSGRPVSADLPRAAGLERQPPSQRFTAEIEVFKTFTMPLLPTYAVPVSTRGLDASWSYDVEQQLIYSPRSSSAGKRYGIDYVRPVFDGNALRTARPLPANHAIQRNFAHVPNVPAVQQQVDELVRGKTTVYDKVRALYDYFSQKNGFEYDLATKEGTTGQHISDFLQNKKGFCEQYAAALTWMVRAAGIPARVAFGFTKGSKFTGGTYTLTSRNLHAWTEVYFDGHGWVPFDATPSASVSGSAVDVTAPWAPNVDAPEETPSTGGPIFTPGPNSTVNPENEDPRRNDLECPECGPNGEPGDTPTPAWVWWTGGGGLAGTILLLMPALRRHTMRRKRSRGVAAPVATVDGAQVGVMAVVSSDHADLARQQAHAAWDELIDTMVDYRITIDAAETPRSTAERLIKREGLHETVAQHARRLGHAEERARYAQQPAAAEGLLPAVKEVRRTLAEQADRWVRFTAVMLPPSVVQRWRGAAFAAGARFSQRVTDFRLALRRLTRPLLRTRV